MDTSNRLDLILWGFRVPASEITGEEWLRIVNRAVEILKTRLKYINAFSELGHLMNPPSNPLEASRVTGKLVTEWPEDRLLGPETRCFVVSELSHKTEGSIDNAAGAYGVKYTIHDQILFTQDEKWVRWIARYQRVPNYGQNFSGRGTVDITEVAETSKFSWVDDKALAEIFRARSETGREIFSALLAAASKTVDGAKTRLVYLERCLDELLDIDSRIGTS